MKIRKMWDLDPAIAYHPGVLPSPPWVTSDSAPPVSILLCLGALSSPTECHSALLLSMPEVGELSPAPSSSQQQIGTGVWTPQLPQPTGGMSLRCVFYTVSKVLCWGEAPVTPAAAGSMTHPSLYHCPTPYWCFFLLLTKSLALESLSQDVPLGKTKPQHLSSRVF